MNLPFQGSTAYTLVDIILINVAIVLSRKKDSSDLIDKDYSTNQMLIFLEGDLLPRLKEHLYLLPGFELYEDKLDEDCLLQLLELFLYIFLEKVYLKEFQ